MPPVAGFNKTTLLVAMVTTLVVVQVACNPLESDSELVGELPSASALSARSEDNTTQHSGNDEYDQEKVCLRRRVLRLLLKLAVLKVPVLTIFQSVEVNKRG